MKYIYHTDGGHGWLAVPLAQVIDLELANKISSCSYLHRGTAYLEEDCDAGLFIAAFKASYGRMPEFTDKYDGSYSPIRQYPYFPSRNY